MSPYCGKGENARKQAHERNAELAITGIKDMIAAGKFDQAIGVATGAIKEYADMSVAGDFHYC